MNSDHRSLIIFLALFVAVVYGAMVVGRYTAALFVTACSVSTAR